MYIGYPSTKVLGCMTYGEVLRRIISFHHICHVCLCVCVHECACVWIMSFLPPCVSWGWTMLIRLGRKWLVIFLVQPSCQPENHLYIQLMNSQSSHSSSRSDFSLWCRLSPGTDSGWRTGKEGLVIRELVQPCVSILDLFWVHSEQHYYESLMTVPQEHSAPWPGQ